MYFSAEHNRGVVCVYCGALYSSHDEEEACGDGVAAARIVAEYAVVRVEAPVVLKPLFKTAKRTEGMRFRNIEAT